MTTKTPARRASGYEELESDLGVRLQRLANRYMEAEALWTKKYCEGGEVEPDYDILPLCFALYELGNHWCAGWVWQPDEATEWTIFAEGSTATAALTALEHLLDKAKQ